MAKDGKLAQPGGSAGLPADAQGNPAIDPTANVIALVDLNVRRLDDLREQESEWLQRVSDMRAEHARELALKESARIDAIRRVDVEASAQQSAAAEIRATTLATQVATAAETLRTTVAAAATAQATALATALAPLTEAIADLRRVQYEQQGQRAGVTETRTGAQVTFGQILGIIAIVLTFLSLGLGALIAFTQ